MKKIISFEKQITFPSMIGEITTLDLEHNLKFIDKSNIEGEFLLTGKYKLTEASRLEEEFSYKLPVEIILTEKLDLNTIKIDIEDFDYEIENEDTMICKINLKIEGVEEIEVFEEEQIEEINEEIEEKIEVRECDYEPKEIEIPKKQIIEQQEELPEENKITSLFNNLSDSEETYSTYSVYILRQEETINTIIEKYKTTTEELEKYNDLTNITIGSKIIIPSTNE